MLGLCLKEVRKPLEGVGSHLLHLASVCKISLGFLGVTDYGGQEWRY